MTSKHRRLGYFIVDRELYENVFKRMQPAHRCVLIEILYQVRYGSEPGLWWDDRVSRYVPVPQGSFITSIDKLSDAAGVSKREVRTALSKLEQAGFVTRKTTSRYTQITIGDYSTYCSPTAYGDKQDDVSRDKPGDPLTDPPADAQVANEAATTEERRILKKEKKRQPKRVKGRRKKGETHRNHSSDPLFIMLKQIQKCDYDRNRKQQLLTADYEMTEIEMFMRTGDLDQLWESLRNRTERIDRRKDSESSRSSKRES